MELTQSFVAQTDFSSYQDFYNRFSIQIPQDFNFSYDIVDEYAQKAPKQLALVWCNDSGEEKRFTFYELSVLSKKYAGYFSSIGITKGKCVMLLLGRRWEYWPIVLALHRLGAIGVPCTEQLTKKDIDYRLSSLNISMIICGNNHRLVKDVEKSVEAFQNDRPYLATVYEKRRNWIYLPDEIEFFPESFPRPDGNEKTHNQDTMLIYFTSGTSGNPKMVKHSFTYPLSHIITAKYWHRVQEESLHFTMAETGWAKASWGKIYGEWICGSVVFVYDMKSFHPKRLLSKIAEYKVNTFCAPPTVYRYLLRENLKKYDLTALRNCCTAGESIGKETLQQFYEQTGIKINEAYGQTEAAVLVGNFEGVPQKPGSIGKKSPLYIEEIVKEDGTVCGPDETGELVIKLKDGFPLGLFTGYYGAEQQTAKTFEDGYYHTGDLIYEDEEKYCWFVSRKDDIIKSAGFRISPYEVESILEQHEAVEECVVSGQKDFKRGQVVKATIVLKKGYNPSKTLKNDLISYMKTETALYKCPRIIEFTDKLSKTYNGKRKRN